MKKIPFYATLLLGCAALSQGGPAYGSTQMREVVPTSNRSTNDNTYLSHNSSDTEDRTFLSFESEKIRKNFYDTIFPESSDHKFITLTFRDRITKTIKDIEDVRAQIQEESIINDKIESLKGKIEENKALLEAQQALFSKYKDSSKEDILEKLNDRKRQYERDLESLSSSSEKRMEPLVKISGKMRDSFSESLKDDTEREMLMQYLKGVMDQIDLLNIDEEQINDENAANETLMEQYLESVGEGDLAKERSALVQTYRNLVDLKLKTVYDLPHPFEDGALIGPFQLEQILTKMGIEKSTRENIDFKNFGKFCGRCLELPMPEREPSNLILSYKDHTDYLIKLYGLRLEEYLHTFNTFTPFSDLITADYNPYEEEERVIAGKVMVSPLQEPESSEGREAFAEIFRKQGYDPDNEKLGYLIGLAIPDSAGFLRALCRSLHNYAGFSFRFDEELPLFVEVAQKIMKEGRPNLDEEFYKSRDQILHAKFQLEVLEEISRNFTKLMTSTTHDSDDDIF